jgi:hypothetical protein
MRCVLPLKLWRGSGSLSATKDFVVLRGVRDFLMWSSEALYAPEPVAFQLLYSLSRHIVSGIDCEAAIAIASVLKVKCCHLGA